MENGKRFLQPAEKRHEVGNNLNSKLERQRRGCGYEIATISLYIYFGNDFISLSSKSHTTIHINNSWTYQVAVNAVWDL